MRAYIVPKLVMLIVEQNLQVRARGGMRDGEGWTYGQVVSVLPELLSVDTVFFVLWLVYVVSRHTHVVPFVPSMWRLNVTASAKGEREEPGCGFVDGGR